MKKEVSKDISSLEKFKKRFVVTVLILFPSVVLLFFFFGIPPSRWQAEKMFSSHTILAYEIWGGDAYMLFRMGPIGAIYFTRLERQGMSMNWGYSGTWYYLDSTDKPANIRVGHCTAEDKLPPKCKSTDLFGQINDKRIATLKVNMNGKWQQYKVFYPGFAIRIYNFNGVPDRYQWIDSNGNVIWSSGKVKPQFE